MLRDMSLARIPLSSGVSEILGEMSPYSMPINTNKVHFSCSFLLQILSSVIFIFGEKMLTLVFGIFSNDIQKACLFFL